MLSATAQDVPSISSDFDLPEDVDSENMHYYVHQAMGSEFTFIINLRDGDIGRADLQPAVQLAFDAIDTLERQISSWIAVSDTSEVNKFASEAPVEIRREAFALFQFSEKMNRETGGAFDITVGPLIDLMRQAEKEGRDPTSRELDEVLKRVGMGKVTLDSSKRSVFYAEDGMRVSFGGIGKGLALDRAAEVLREYGIEIALLNGGRSSILAMGAPPGKECWKIGIRNPYNENISLGVVDLKDQALSTSACYYELARERGKPCGIYDPQTGETATGLWSATVIAQSGMQTDALSTAFYVMGVDGVREYCTTHPEVYAVLVPAPEQKGSVPKPIRIGN